MAISWDIDYLEVYPDALLLPHNRIPTLTTMSLGAMYVVCCMVAQKFDHTIRVKSTSDLLYSIITLSAHDAYVLAKQIYHVVATTNYGIYSDFSNDPNLNHLKNLEHCNKLQNMNVKSFLQDAQEYLLPLAAEKAAAETLNNQTDLVLSL